MQRLVFCGLGLLCALALSCQVLPTGLSSASPDIDREVAALPPVSAGAPAASLRDRLSYIEGGAPASQRDETIAAVISHFGERHTGLSGREIRRVAETIVDACGERDVELKLVLGVIDVESAGYHRAVSPVGAIGLMQIMPATGKKLAEDAGMVWRGPEMLFDPVVNVSLGIAYLQELSDRYDHVPTALAAYNWGPGRIDSRIRRGARMPQIYVEQVRRAIDRAEQGQARKSGAAS